MTNIISAATMLAVMTNSPYSRPSEITTNVVVTVQEVRRDWRPIPEFPDSLPVVPPYGWITTTSNIYQRVYKVEGGAR